MRLRFAEGTSAQIYRKTVADGGAPEDPCILSDRSADLPNLALRVQRFLKALCPPDPRDACAR